MEPRAGARDSRRIRTLLLAVNLVIVAGTLPWVSSAVDVHWPGTLAWFLGFLMFIAASAFGRFEPAMRRQGPLTVTAMVLTLVLLTGGASSPYAALYLPLIGFVAVFRETWTFCVTLAASAVAALLPGVLADDPTVLASDVVIVAAASATFAAVHLVALRYRTASDLYLAVLENHVGPTYVLTREGRFRTANAATQEVLGMALEDIVGTPWTEVVAAGEADRLMPIFQAALAGRPLAFSVLTDAPGGRFHLRGTALPIRTPAGVSEVMGVTTDVTEETEAMFDAQALRHALDGLGTPAAIFDAQTQQTLYNNRAALNLRDRIGYDGPTLAWDELDAEIRHNVPALGEVGEVQFVGGATPDRQWRVIIQHVIRDHRGIVALTAVDTTATARQQQALQALLHSERETAERLRSVDALKNSFLSATSHELRTPLTVILGVATTLQRRREELDSEARTTLEDTLANQARRLDRLLADLLDVDRLVRGATRTSPSSFDVSGLVHRVSGDVRQPERITIEAPEHLVSFADETQVERIVANLLDNTAKYAPDGPVRVEVEPLPGGGFRLSVADHGPGVPEHELEQIFEPFHRVDLGHPQPGTGIGLALVAEFAAVHGGRAWAESPEGKGLRIVVEMPERRSGQH